MNWEMISAVGQMLGAIGVIISIVYLAAQIRNQNKESRRQAMNVLTTHWSDLNRTLVENPEWPCSGFELCDLSTIWMPSRS
jgi:heme/copper-type cytochrome/quinol oxidase subunit 1